MAYRGGNLPGPGDRATWPRLITSAMDPDYSEWEIDCPTCDGSGSIEDEDRMPLAYKECPECEGTGQSYASNMGERR